MNNKYTQFNFTPFETHMLVWEKIREGSRVFDLGCATGYMARELKKKNCKVWGVDIDKEAISEAKKYCEKAVVLDLETAETLPFQQNFFDDILLLDILEHLRNPDKLLKLLQKYLKKDGKIIISVPNIAFISIRLALLRGKFDYQKIGIMDETHLHFYTKKSFIDLMERNGLEIKEIDSASGFSQITLLGKYLNYIPKIWQYRITKLADTLLAYQFIFICRPI